MFAWSGSPAGAADGYCRYRPSARPLSSIEEMIGKVDAAIVAVPTSAHAEVACRLLDAGIDVLVEKPIAATLTEADRMIAAAERDGRILQVGHLERFNPAIVATRKDCHAAAVFRDPPDERVYAAESGCGCGARSDDPRSGYCAGAGARGADRDSGGGISILSPKVDIANVRLEFADGCMANLTASRVSTEKIRKVRVFQPRAVYFARLCEAIGCGIYGGGRRGAGFRAVPVSRRSR